MNKIYFLIVVFAAVMFSSCSKDETDGMPTLETGAVGNINKDISTDSNFDPEALDAMNVKFDVEVVADDPVKSVEVSISHNDGEAVVFETLQSKSEKVTVTVDKLKNTLSISDDDFEKGDKFSFFVSKIEMVDGRVFEDKKIETNQTDDEGKPVYLEPTNLGGDFVMPSPVFNTQIDYYIACQFDPALTIGSYHVVSDDWGAEGDVEITADPSDPYKIYIAGMPEMEGLTTGNGNSMEVNIDPVSFQTSGPKAVSATDLSDWGLAAYTNYYYQPVGGLFLSCDGTYILTLKIGVDQGGWGNFIFTYTRN